MLDDPDPEVYTSVSNKLVSYGKDIIVNLENYWSDIPDELVQERIEQLLHKVYFIDVQDQLTTWAQKAKPDIFEAMLICSQYKYNNIDIAGVRKSFKAMYQSTWLELNNYLSPIEQVNVLSSVLYNMYKLKSFDLLPEHENCYFIHYVLENKNGNTYTLGALFLQLCELLDIPIYAVDVPGQFILAYYDTVYSYLNPLDKPIKKILFYIDPINGMVYTQNDVDAYLKKMNLDPQQTNYKRTLNNKEILLRYLKNLLNCYETNELINDKQKEILALIDIVKQGK